ncbi:MAG: class I SAM-dependent DNA methyltransferase [Planctomycetota bacterium]|nr:MAG: class I SAM-dependent DNA methyltransferase [Planctomycetota bacterium]
MGPSEFAAKWRGSTRTERAAAQEHFIDLCQMLGVPTPNEDPTGDSYAFEKGAEKVGGGDGFADVWKKRHFAWEYKGRRKNLDDAYQQLLQYREALENPPLLVVSDLDRFEVHTNFTGTAKKVYRFALADLVKESAEPLRVLRAVMSDPEVLRPTTTRQEITEEAAQEFASLAFVLRGRGFEAHRVAHFLNKLLFSMFAEDAGLLPKGLVKRIAEGTRNKPAAFAAALAELFEKMSKSGGLFGPEPILWFNGGLFDGADVIPMESAEIDVVRRVSELDWSEVEPSIFGTLFVRGLDPDRRSQLGAQYTDRDSILRLVEPVLIAPLRREFAEMQARIEALLPKWEKASAKGRASMKPENNPERVLRAFLDRLASIRVLDPACGSGNFLYVSLQLLKDLEREVIDWGLHTLKTVRYFPSVGPQVLRGIEINDYAAELARVTIWIGEIQWMLAHGFAYRTDPILQPLDNIECRDAILDRSDPGNPREPSWPEAEVIVGNPPFLGGKLLRSILKDEYVDALFRVYDGRVPREADLVVYWHEKARAMVESGATKRVGLLATQGIRGGANRQVLERIKDSGDIFLAWSDRRWVLDGAAVHVSFLGYDDGSEEVRMLDGQPVGEIHANLTAGTDLTQARRLRENLGISFMGDTKGGPFDISEVVARQLLAQPNPDGRTNADVVRPWLNGLDVTRRPRGMWIVDFGVSMSEETAALYEAPFENVRCKVKPTRARNKREAYAAKWWLHVEPRSGMRKALSGLPRYIATPTVAKHRLFVWLPATTLPDHQLIVIARDDDYSFGVLHSRVHELWALRTGTQLETRPRYTPTSTFETFPFPRPTKEQEAEIAAAAQNLHELREGWLNPPNLAEGELKKRTLTNLYNARPTWLNQAHERVDHAVLDAYGWPHGIVDDDLLARLLALNLEREAT